MRMTCRPETHLGALETFCSSSSNLGRASVCRRVSKGQSLLQLVSEGCCLHGRLCRQLHAHAWTSAQAARCWVCSARKCDRSTMLCCKLSTDSHPALCRYERSNASDSNARASRRQQSAAGGRTEMHDGPTDGRKDLHGAGVRSYAAQQCRIC